MRSTLPILRARERCASATACEYPFDRRNDGEYQQFRISAEAFQTAICAKTRKATDGEASQAITLAAAFPKRPTWRERASGSWVLPIEQDPARTLLQ
jgi:hypothetical protein